MATNTIEEREVDIQSGDLTLRGDLTIPSGARSIVVFAHGSGSGRHSPRNRQVARFLNDRSHATLLMDLLTVDEERIDMRTAHLRFDIPLLAERVVMATKWLQTCEDTRELRVGYFGASTGGGAALVAAARIPDLVGAVVSRGGRPDLAEDALPLVQAPTLLIVGERDEPVIQMNRRAMARMQGTVRLEIVPRATHLFEEPGTLEEVSRLAGEWFSQYLVDEVDRVD